MLQRNPLLGTLAQVEASAPSAPIAEFVEAAVFAEAQRLEAIFTIYDPASALHELRRLGTTTVPELLEVRALAADWTHKTNGAFSATLQPIVELWNQAEATGEAPSEVDRLAAVALADAMSHEHLDLNGVAKGWIADRSLAIALDTFDEPVDGAWLNLGGDLVHRGSGQVVVGIEDPTRPYDNVAPLFSVVVSNEALATSGGARRWWDVGNTRYSKVLDPRTGRPSARVASASVIAPTAAAADVLATVALVLEVEETLDLMADLNASCLLIRDDGNVIAPTNRFKPTSGSQAPR